MIVTICTDASFNRRHEIGTFAFYMRSNLGTITMSGQLRKKCKRAEEAEIKCIINALMTLTMYSEWMRMAKHIIINTDCLNAIHILNNDEAKVRAYKLTKIKNGYFLYKKKTLPLFEGKKIELRHIKAHEHTDTPAHFVNDWADQAAKREMALYIKKVENLKKQLPC